MATLTEIFFGRDKELEVLRALTHEVRAGNSVSVFVSGRRGIGKTSLMRYLYNHLFWEQDSAIPFFYSINPALTRVSWFSEDYIIKFIQQGLAFFKKDEDILRAGICLLEDIRVLSKRSDSQWAVEIIDDFLCVKTANNPVNIFLSAISAPIRAYQYTGKPVIVMIDDFHFVRDVYEFKTGEGKNIWLQFEEPIKYPYTPHLLTGNQSLLNKMFFYEASFGGHLKLIDLKGLDREGSKKLFMSLCDAYRINVNTEADLIIDRLQGNPTYIRALALSARQAGRRITEDELWNIYYNEITDGGIFTYWISHLKRYIPIHLRELSLRLLYYLCNNDREASLSDLANLSFINKEELNNVLDCLQTAGVLKGGFSTFKLIDDPVLADVINEIYNREVLKEAIHVKREKADKKTEDIKDESQMDEVKTAFNDAMMPSEERRTTDRAIVYVLSLIIAAILAVIIYMNISRDPQQQAPIHQEETISLPFFRDDAFERTLKSDQRQALPSFRDDALTRVMKE